MFGKSRIFKTIMLTTTTKKNNLKDGRHRGIAYVEYEKREDAENAVKYMDQVNLFIY